jgi:5-methylcytosine-specific restriction endonuclease McrA
MGLGYRLFSGEPTRKQIKAKRDRAEAKARELARAAAYNRPWVRGCCQRCGVPLKLKPSEARSEFEIAHAHEIDLRSAGGSATDTRNLVILCLRCHLRGLHRQTANEAEWFVIIVRNEELGADDPEGISFEPWRGRYNDGAEQIRPAGGSA